MKIVLAVYLVGVFGDTRASHVYNTIGRSLDYKHNHLREIKGSETYIDDGIIVDTAENLDHSMNDYCHNIAFTLGEEAIKDEKRKNYGYDLQAIGFAFNLREEVWRVGPKRKGILKMYLALFMLLPTDFTDEDKTIKVTKKRLLQVASLLSWYAQVMPAGKSFIHSLYRNAGWGPDSALVEVSVNAKRDVHWWKIIVMISLKNPNFLSAKISHMRVDKNADVSLYTDASKTIGGGAWVEQLDQGISLEGFIRWTKEEIELFENSKASSMLDPQVGVSVRYLPS
jgi:hypothetical protein